ncbi:hypothetical protein GCM10028815_12340 [Mariniluteicoccus flavus]
MTLHPLDLVVIGIYFLAMIGIGFWSMRMAKTREDYLVAGRRLKFPLFFACMAAMAVGGAVTVGGTGKGYKDGIAGLWVGGSLGMGLIVLGMLVSSKLNRLRALSINEVIERNYGAAARVFGAVLTIIYTVALSVVQVVAMGSILAGILGIDTRMARVYAGLVVVFYTFLGGMWSVTMTDIVQFVIKTLGPRATSASRSPARSRPASIPSSIRSPRSCSAWPSSPPASRSPSPAWCSRPGWSASCPSASPASCSPPPWPRRCRSRPARSWRRRPSSTTTSTCASSAARSTPRSKRPR